MDTVYKYIVINTEIHLPCSIKSHELFLKSFIWKLKTEGSYAVAVCSELLILWTKKIEISSKNNLYCSAVFWVIMHFSHGFKRHSNWDKIWGETRDNKN